MGNTVVNTAFNTVARKVGMPEACNLQVNVSDTERVVSAVGGGALIGLGLSSKGLAGILLPIAGGMLAIRGLSGHCSLYSMLGIDTSCTDATNNPNTAIPAGEGVRVETSIAIDRPVQELYEVWRGLERLPEFMSHLREVHNTFGVRSHWIAKGPFGMTVEWDAEIINERPYELMAWKSVHGSDVDTAGSVHFESTNAGNSTIVRVNLKYDPPAGQAGIAIAKLFGQDPETQLREDLERFKELMESQPPYDSDRNARSFQAASRMRFMP